MVMWKVVVRGEMNLGLGIMNIWARGLESLMVLRVVMFSIIMKVAMVFDFRRSVDIEVSCMLASDLCFVISLHSLFSLLFQTILLSFVHFSLVFLSVFSLLLHTLLTFLELFLLELFSFFSLLDHSLLLCTIDLLSALFSLSDLLMQSLLVLQLLEFHSLSSHLKIDAILFLQRSVVLVFIPALLR